MTPPARQQDLDLAIRMAKDVAPLGMRWFSSVDLAVRTKDDGSPVTQADIAIEQQLRELIASADPQASIIAEEGDDVITASARRWYVDPIDGTAPFVHGVPLWSTLIALEDEHGPAIGVISLPAVGELIAAGRGLGCTFNGNPCSVNERNDLAGALVTTWGFDDWPLALLDNLQRRNARIRTWGDAYGWGLVATGRADAVIDSGVSTWDLAPMRVILPEAGGRFSASDGEDSIERGTGVGTNGALHDELLALLKASGL